MSKQITRSELRRVDRYAQEVDEAIQEYCGISLYDLAPVDLQHIQDKGISPRVAARIIIRTAHEEGEV